MSSIGNDIVDLSLIDAARSRQTRFYSKILAPAELLLYEQFAAALPFEFYVWLCWTVKEATYKFSKRLNTQLLFSPPRTVVLNMFVTPKANGSCLYEGTCTNGLYSVHFQSSQTTNYIHTIAIASAGFGQITADVFKVEDALSSVQTHTRLLHHASLLHPHSTLSIKKSTENIPTLMVDLNEYPVSMAHHGQYGSFAMADSVLL